MKKYPERPIGTCACERKIERPSTMTGRRETVMDGPSRGGPRPPNEINRDPPLSAGRLPAGHGQSSRRSQAAWAAARAPPIRDSSFLRYRSPEESNGITHSDASKSPSGDPGIRDTIVREIVTTIGLSSLSVTRTRANAIVRSHSRAHPLVSRPVIGIDMRVQSTRGRWTVLASFAIVYIANLRLGNTD